jgi:hypothetical protein
VIIPFADDPKFKTFQSMAALAGARIHYEFSFLDNNIIVAASFADNGGDSIHYLPKISPVMSAIYNAEGRVL